MNPFTRYRKAVLMVLLTIAAFLYGALTDGMSDNEWVLTASAGVGAVGVWLVPNLDDGIAYWTKGIVAFASPALGVIAIQITGGLTAQEWLEALLVGAAAVGLVVPFGNGPKELAFHPAVTTRTAVRRHNAGSGSSGPVIH
jgi:hypothetical protein